MSKAYQNLVLSVCTGYRGFCTLAFLFFISINVMAQNAIMVPQSKDEKAGINSRKYEHRLGIENRMAYVFPTKSFFQGEESLELTSFSYSPHLRFSFHLPAHSPLKPLYGDSYWGIGLSKFYFGNKNELGNPFALYIFQGTRLASLGRKIQLNFEWNFGVSGGWQPYDIENNPNNKVVGSRFNAYINTGLVLNWQLSDFVSMELGSDLTHFSNGNTQYPNSGLNMVGGKLGITYKLDTRSQLPKAAQSVAEFQPHISYDVIAYGSWRKKGVEVYGSKIPSPYTYTVMGMNLSALYNFTYKFRAGLSLDPLYDGSANVYGEPIIVGPREPNPGPIIVQPPFGNRLALGLSARSELVLPVFTIGMGIGRNVLRGGKDFDGTYQVFWVKARTSKTSFIHVGYNLKDFEEANFLMLGLGFTLNNQRPD